MARVLGIAVAVTVILAGAMFASIAGAVTQGVTENEVLIGSAGPLTGDSYIYGKLMMNGLETYFDEINKKGGIHGRKLKLVREDDQCKGEAAIAAAKKLAYDHRVFAVVGWACSGASIAAKPEIVKSGVPTVINIAVADELTYPPEKNIFSVTTTSGLESRAQVKYVLDMKAQKIAVIAQQDSWGRSRYGPLLEYMKQKGVSPVVDVEISEETKDATPQALKLQGSGAEVVLMLTRPKAGVALMRDAMKIGYKPQWVAQTAIADLVAFKQQVGIPGALDKFVTITQTLYQPSDPEMADWAKKVQAIFPRDNLSPFTLNGISGGMVLVEALRRTGRDLTWERFLQAMESLKNFDTGIMAGPITCTPQSHQCLQGMGWVKEVGGKVTFVGKTVLD